MLVSTIIVVWRSRPSALARAHKRKSHAVGDLERDPSRAKDKRECAMEKEKEADTSLDSTSSVDPDSPIPPPTPAMHSCSAHSIPSTLNVIISPSVPHLVKLGADGALEVRVTPPSPVLIPRGGSMRFGGLPGGTPGENDSVWWVI